MATADANDNSDKRPDSRASNPPVKTVQVKNQSNRSIEIETSTHEAIVFAPHETKQVDEKFRSLMLPPLFIQEAK